MVCFFFLTFTFLKSFHVDFFSLTGYGCVPVADSEMPSDSVRLCVLGLCVSSLYYCGWRYVNRMDTARGSPGAAAVCERASWSHTRTTVHKKDTSISFLQQTTPHQSTLFIYRQSTPAHQNYICSTCLLWKFVIPFIKTKMRYLFYEVSSSYCLTSWHELLCNSFYTSTGTDMRTQT